MDARIIGSYIYHKGSTFDSTSVQAALDTGKSLAREESGSVTLSYSNMINTSRGLNGLVFDIENLPAISLSTSDFVFQMSPQGVYTQSSNPPEGWTAAPAPSQIQVIAASGGNPPRVIIRWADNDIKNRWLRVTIKSNEDTGLFNDEIFYAGHLLGETTGATSGTYTVAFSDQTSIRNAIGQSATVSSILDINKDGIISFADLSAVTPNIGTQQENITTAVNPLADLTRSQSWNLDALGNFESLTNNDGTPVTSTHNLQNQVTGVGLASLSFDANGNMTVDEQGRTFIWDAWNRLVEVKQGSTTLVEYQYDGLKRRIVEDDGTDEKDLYYSDQWQVLEERVDGDTVTQYVWSAVYVDAMILRDRDADANTGNGLEERIYVLHDANYNVTAIVDTSGEVLERYYYEAYGRAVYLDDAFALQPDGQSEHAWQHLHQGGRLDEATGDYHFRHRDLSPTLGRWISQDPIGFEAGDANLYRYVGNGPGNRMDPFGLHDIELCGSDLNTNCPYINRELRRVKSIVKETGEVNKFYAVDTCVTWMLACMDKKFEDIERNGPFRRITMTPIEFPLSGFQPAIIHAALEIKINGTEHVFYLDNGGLGGTDHIFFPKDLEGFPKYGKPQPFGTVKEFDGDINTMLILPPVIPGLTGPFVR